MRVRPLFASILVAVVVAACYRAPGASSDPGLARASAAPTPATTATPEPVATEQPTEPPTPEPTVPPTPKPTPKPTKAPLPWKDSGSIDVPFEIHAGTTIRFRLWDFSAPATCSLTFTWPDATVSKLATKTATVVGAPPGSSNPYGIDWNLAIPATQVGEGKFSYVCKYLGVTRLDSWFTISIQAPL